MSDSKEFLKLEIPKLVWDALNFWTQQELIKTERGSFTQEIDNRIELIVSQIYFKDELRTDRRRKHREIHTRKHLKQDIENVIWDSMRKWGQRQEIIIKIKEVSSDIQSRIEELFSQIDLDELIYDRRTGERRDEERRKYEERRK